jgi:hypothetical protein
LYPALTSEFIFSLSRLPANILQKSFSTSIKKFPI